MKILSSVLFVFAFLLAGCGTPTENGILIHTADPSLSFFIPVTPVADIAPADEVGKDLPIPTPEPPCEIVKGNISRNGEKIYHAPSSPNYNQVKIDETAGEQFFCSIEEAEAAGWRAPQ